jgi:hypothetical protein
MLWLVALGGWLFCAVLAVWALRAAWAQIPALSRINPFTAWFVSVAAGLFLIAALGLSVAWIQIDVRVAPIFLLGGAAVSAFIFAASVGQAETVEDLPAGLENWIYKRRNELPALNAAMRRRDSSGLSALTLRLRWWVARVATSRWFAGQ